MRPNPRLHTTPRTSSLSGQPRRVARVAVSSKYAALDGISVLNLEARVASKQRSRAGGLSSMSDTSIIYGSMETCLAVPPLELSTLFRVAVHLSGCI